MFLFVIDTNQYAGNFERPMASYITGHVAHCGTGGEEAAVFHKDQKLSGLDDLNHPFKNVLLQDNDYSNKTPGIIYPTPGFFNNFFNNGVGGAYPDDFASEIKAIEDRNEYWLKEAGKWKTMVDSDKDRKARGLHKDSCQKRYDEFVDRTKEPLRKYPSYQSVAILFEAEPTKEQQLLVRTRATKFPLYWKKKQGSKIEITGARIFERKEVLVEELKW